MTERAGQLSSVWTYDIDLFNSDTIERMQGHFVRLLESIVARPDARLKSLEMFTDEEKQQQAAKDARLEEASLKHLMSARRRAVRQPTETASGD
jgi:non-ribosomal peptide synthetase component F